MSAQHTPGPWIATAESPAGWVDVVTLDADGYPSLPFVSCKHFNAIANARFIAAAPDMLAALHEALEFAKDQEDVDDGPDGEQVPNEAMRLAQTLRAAIAKATGGTA